MKEDEKRQKGFGFEDLQVWSKAIDFAKDVIQVIDRMDISQRHMAVIEKLESASIGVSANIAEGKGRYAKEFIRYLYTAQGYLATSVSHLMLMQRTGWLKSHALEELKSEAEHLTRMIYSLIKAVKENTQNDSPKTKNTKAA